MKKYVYNEYDVNPVYHTYKQRKKRKLKKKVKIICILFILMIIVGYLLSPYSKIKTIQVRGNENISKEEIIEYISVDLSSYYFLVDKKNIQNEVKECPVIKQVSVQMDWVGHLIIEVEEASPIAYAQINDIYYEINDIGNIVEIDNIEGMKSLPFVSHFKDKDILKKFAEGFCQVPSLMQNEISDIILESQKADPHKLKCLMKDNKKVYVRIEDLATKLNDEQFNYEAYKSASKDNCIFSIEGRNVYMSPCE